MFRKKNYIIFFMCLACRCSALSLQSEYTGGITQSTLIGTLWREINGDFNGTFQRWFFKDSTTLIQNLRGAILYYTWEPYTLVGTVSPNPENQAIFKVTSGSPGGQMDQYMLVWFINKEGTTAVFEIYTDLQDITRFLVNINKVYAPNYEQVPTTFTTPTKHKVSL
ncbi:MAG: hypothetical protein ACRCTQ_04365 [Brevinemataceae bacterium]